MSKQWCAVFLALTLVASLPISVTAAGPATSTQQTTDQVVFNTTDGYNEGDTPITKTSYSPVTIEATYNNSTIPWKSNSPGSTDALPVFVGDTVDFRIESKSDRNTIEHVSWTTDGPADVTPTTNNGTTARTQFETHGKTTLEVTTTLRDTTFGSISNETTEYTLIATSENFTVDEFSIEYLEPPSRWHKAAVYAHLHDLPDLHQNFSQRLPIPAQVNLLYANNSEIKSRCQTVTIACVDQSNNNTIYMNYNVGGKELSHTEVYEHELTHVAQFHGMNMEYRQEWRFIVEGQAEYEESHQFSTRTLEEKPSQQQILGFQTGYNAADLFVSAFIVEYGHQSVNQLIELSGTATVDQAFQQTVNTSFDSFYTRWAPTNASQGPNAVRAVRSSAAETDTIHQKPRFVYYDESLSALGFDSYSNTDGVTVTWDTNNDGTIDTTGQRVAWTPRQEGDHTIMVTYTNGNASLSRTQTVTISDVPLKPQDIDNDGLYEDVNGNGAFTISDVQALFVNLDSDAVKQNPAAFDFNGNGAVSISDVQALFTQLASSPR